MDFEIIATVQRNTSRLDLFPAVVESEVDVQDIPASPTARSSPDAVEEAEATVEGELVCAGELMFSLVD